MEYNNLGQGDDPKIDRAGEIEEEREPDNGDEKFHDDDERQEGGVLAGCLI